MVAQHPSCLHCDMVCQIEHSVRATLSKEGLHRSRVGVYSQRPSIVKRAALLQCYHQQLWAARRVCCAAYWLRDTAAHLAHQVVLPQRQADPMYSCAPKQSYICKHKCQCSSHKTGAACLQGKNMQQCCLEPQGVTAVQLLQTTCIVGNRVVHVQCKRRIHQALTLH